MRTRLPETTDLLTGPVLIELESGHVLDLCKAMEYDDDPRNDMLLVTLPAPSFQPLDVTIDDDGSGPYCLVLSGESRRLALSYVRWSLGRTRAALELLASEL
jgi:hypothetical protein